MSMKMNRSQKMFMGSSSRNQKRASVDFLPYNNKRPYVQPESVSSQRMGGHKQSLQFGDRNATVLNQNNRATLVMPTITKCSWNINKEKDDSIVNELMVDETDSESDTEYDPVILPLDRNKSTFADCFKVKQEDIDKIKNEYCSNLKETTVYPLFKGCSTTDTKPKIKIEKFEESTTERYCIFTDGTQGYDEFRPAFSLIRLPDSFLGKTRKEDLNAKDADYALKHMPEGHIGKILIRKSGKKEMVIRNTKYVLNADDAEGLPETVVLYTGEQDIALNPALVTLGNITKKFALTPEWNTLFNYARSKNRL